MRRIGVLVISHGSRDAGWVAMVDEAVLALQVPADVVAVECSFLEIVEGRLMQDGTNRLLAQGVTDMIVVPLFVSSGSTHIDEIAWAMGAKAEAELETDLAKVDTGDARIHWVPPMDDDAEVIAMLLANVRELSEAPANEVLLVVGHGSIERNFHQRWKRGLTAVAEQLVAAGGFAGAEICMLLPDQVQWRMREVARKWPGCRVLVVPVFLSEGYFTRTVIPQRLAGYTYAYNGKSLLPQAGVTAWMQRRIEQQLGKMNVEE